MGRDFDIFFFERGDLGERGGDDSSDDDDDARGDEGVEAERGEGGVLVRDSGVRKDGEVNPLQLPDSVVGIERARSRRA